MCPAPPASSVTSTLEERSGTMHRMKGRIRLAIVALAVIAGTLYIVNAWRMTR